ncbi:MAG TPA: hypothetical protein VHP33_06230 [Polyangiaceae bacterium]|nr:hypothetical protein [Polyangiaceae bacterium]
MYGEYFALPGDEEAEYLLAGLAKLIRQRGVETFVSAPLLLAEPRFFPDPVPARAAGVSVLLRRLLSYAGLEPERLDIELYTDDAHGLVVHEGEANRAHVAAWFMEIADGVYRFGVREAELRDEQALIGTLGHEVAHAYRYHHGLVVPNRATEEQLTDLTTVYLGFGAFTLESSYQFKSGHYSATGERLAYEWQTRGYLRPGQLAFLLGAQLAARGAREDSLAQVLDSLSSNQADSVRKATLLLSEDREGLLHSLGLPAPAGWPPLHTLEQRLDPLPDAEVSIHDQPQVERRLVALEHVGFRLVGNRAMLGLVLGLGAGFVSASLLDLYAAFWPWGVAVGALGWLTGRSSKAYSCSACSHGVPHEAARCNFCSLKLVADIRDPAERFAAEERYRAEHAAIRCPRCAWVPTADDSWECECGQAWNTFETAGRCPACAKSWETTWCLECREPSEHQAWYADGRAGP